MIASKNPLRKAAKCLLAVPLLGLLAFASPSVRAETPAAPADPAAPAAPTTPTTPVVHHHHHHHHHHHLKSIPNPAAPRNDSGTGTHS